MGRKRHRREIDQQESDVSRGLATTLDNLNARPGGQEIEGDAEGWNTIKPKNKKPKVESDAHSYPAIYHANYLNLSSRVKLKDIQELVLYVLGNGTSPKWVAVRNSKGIRKVVVLMVPGLEPGMFDGSIALKGNDLLSSNELSKTAIDWSSPDSYYPTKLDADALDDSLKALATMFPHMYPVDTGGDRRYARIHSPLQMMLTVPREREADAVERKKARRNSGSRAKSGDIKPTPINSYFATVEDMLEDDYTLHSSQNPSESLQDKWKVQNRTSEYGWTETNLSKDPAQRISDDPLTDGWQVLAIDCEMCRTEASSSELTRISVIDWRNKVVMDELVKPAAPITDYVTEFSGITKEMLDPVTTTLADVQSKLLDLIDSKTVLVGHSLVSDLTALKLVHPHVIDTSIVFPHPKGPPLKSALKFLSKKYLNREIRKGGHGHNPVEDAQVALDLIRRKCQFGPSWGSSQANEESIFAKLGRMARTSDQTQDKLFTGIVDWGTPERGHGHGANAIIGCDNDDAVAEGVIGLIGGSTKANQDVPTEGADFVWARLRELEAKRGWWTQGRSDDNEAARIKARGKGAPEAGATLGSAVAETIGRVQAIWDELPPATALVVYSGAGDTRDLKKYNDMHKQYKQEFQTKRWDELDVQWTDEEERLRDEASRKARSGVGFVTVK